MKRTLGIRQRSTFSCAVLLILCCGLALTGCNSASAPPPDTTPPTAPTSLVTTVASSSQINLSWTASTDNVGVTGYKVERCQGAACSNFAQIATPTATSFNDTGLTASTSYSYRVRATDAEGNLSTFSGPSTAMTMASNAAISVSISPRRGGAVISQAIGFTASVQNDVGAAGVTWTKTGGAFTNSRHFRYVLLHNCRFVHSNCYQQRRQHKVGISNRRSDRPHWRHNLSQQSVA